MSEETQNASEDLVEAAKAEQAKTKNPLQRGTLFFRQVVAELGKVTRPTRKELINYTGVVLGFVVVVMAIISALDWIFYNVVTFVFAG